MANKSRKNILKLNKEGPVIMIFQEGPCHKEDHLFPGMDLMLIVFIVLNLVIRLWIVDSRSSVVSSNNSVGCWKCNHVGHIVTYFHTMRCYSCSGIGHKKLKTVGVHGNNPLGGSHTTH